MILALDTLASGLDPAARRALAGRRRRAHDAELEEDPAPELRARQRRLIDLLAAPPEPCLRARQQLRALPPLDERLWPPLLHLCVNRRDPAEEARAYYFWERALDGLTHRKPATPRAP